MRTLDPPPAAEPRSAATASAAPDPGALYDTDRYQQAISWLTISIP